MKVVERKFSVRRLVESFGDAELSRNSEYQRGEKWNERQKASFIDSILRGYPIPALFFRLKERINLAGIVSMSWEIIDGQQRLCALRDFYGNSFNCWKPEDLKIPYSVRDISSEWSGKAYDSLSQKLTERLDNTEISVFEVGGEETTEDEVRDLFIRLQSGTPLSRQQIRDAWPGALGPYIVGLAGKLQRRPGTRLFGHINLSGVKGDGADDDEHVDHHEKKRHYCAQLFRIFSARAVDAYSYPSVSAKELDLLYYENAGFDTNGGVAEKFKQAIDEASEILDHCGDKKFRRFEVTSLVLFIQDMSRRSNYKLDGESKKKLAMRMLRSQIEITGRGTSGKALREFYDTWRDKVSAGIGIDLDSRRNFSDRQKQDIWEKDGGKCFYCGDDVDVKEAEYHHYPIPYRDGGKTSVDNGKLVHRGCHERGRPSSSVGA